MSDTHVTPEVLEAVYRNMRNAPLRGIVLGHLARCCPECRKSILAFEANLEPGERFLPPAEDSSSEEPPEEDPEHEKRARRDIRALARLVDLDERLRKARNAISRFRGRTFARLALEKSRDCLPTSPERSWCWATIASLALTTGSSDEDSLRLLAVALRANALRAQGRIEEAAAGFELVHHLLRTHGTADTRMLAEIYSLEGSLRTDQRKLARADYVLRRSLELYRLSGSPIEAAKMLLKLGAVAREDGRLTEAIAFAEEALAVVDPENHTRLYLCARHNIALYLCEIGDAEAAALHLTADRPLYQVFDDAWTRERFRWLEGRIAHARGDLERAEKLLTACRNGLAASDSLYNVALVSLDLALVYLDEGRHGKLREIAQELLDSFSGFRLPWETQATLLLLQNAVWDEVVSAEVLARVGTALRRLAPHHLSSP